MLRRNCLIVLLRSLESVGIAAAASTARTNCLRSGLVDRSEPGAKRSSRNLRKLRRYRSVAPFNHWRWVGNRDAAFSASAAKRKLLPTRFLAIYSGAQGAEKFSIHAGGSSALRSIGC